MSFIYICPIDPFEQSLIEPIIQTIEEVLDLPSKVFPAPFKTDIAYDYSREQYKSSTLLKGILNNLPSNTLKIVGITDVDLFVPVLTFVFGEAQLNGKAAIVSITRLRNEFYGLPKNDELLKNRLIKEILHELGHTFGLIHCRNYDCVMNSSMYVENIDLKSEQFCRQCWEILSQTITKL